MRKKFKYYKPNKIITLIDLTKGEYPYGALIFNYPKPISEPAPIQNPSQLSTFKLIQERTLNFFNLIDFGLLFRFIKTNLLTLPQVKSIPKVEIPKVIAPAFPLKVVVLNAISALCIAIALLGVLSFAYPYFSSQINRLAPKNNNTAIVAKTVETSPSPSPTPETTEFILTIPSINITSDVTPSVDIGNEVVYKQELQRTGVAHAYGSFLPNQDGPVLLFAHSTDTLLNVAEYNAKFFEVPNLKNDDEIQVQYHGKIYTYKVTGRKIIQPTDFAAIENATSDLILMTCTPPGTTWMRLLIFADKISEKAV